MRAIAQGAAPKPSPPRARRRPALARRPLPAACPHRRRMHPPRVARRSASSPSASSAAANPPRVCRIRRRRQRHVIRITSGSTLINAPARSSFQRASYRRRRSRRRIRRRAMHSSRRSSRREYRRSSRARASSRRTRHAASPSSESTTRNSGIIRGYDPFGPAASAAATFRAATSSAARCASMPLADASRRSTVTSSPP